MAVNPRDMDGFMPLLSTTDIKKKLNVGNALLNYLGDSSKSIECQDIGMFIDNVIPWLGNGNPKVRTLREASSRPSEVSSESLRTRLTYTCRIMLACLSRTSLAYDSTLRVLVFLSLSNVETDMTSDDSRDISIASILFVLCTRARARARIHTSARA